MIITALALGIKKIGYTTALVMVTYGGGKVQDYSTIRTFQSGAERIAMMHKYHELHDDDIGAGLYTFQCDQSK